MKTDREKIPLVLRRTERGLEPRSRLASDLLAAYAIHSDVEVTIKKRRSIDQLRFYWVGLQRAVEAGVGYPTAEHLHDAIKMDLGYTTPLKKLDGTIEYVPDSVAIARMDSVKFNAFFEAARKLFIETFKFDPWSEND